MSKEKKLEALLVIVLGLAILSIIFGFKWFLYASVIIGVGSMVFPPIGDAILFGWFKLAQVLGWINSRILLAIVFFVFLFPLGMLYRLFSKDPLKLKGKQDDSLFKTRDYLYTKKDLENIW